MTSPHWKPSSSRGGRARAGLTLFEMILALAVVALLAAVAVVSFTSVREKASLPTEAGRLESMIRMARAESATLGRRIQLQFDGENAPRVLWEPDPLAAPGKFENYAACPWANQFDADAVDVVSCRLTGEGSPTDPEEAQASGEEHDDLLDTITFYPDGRTDSAVIDLRSADEADTRTARITLDGTNGLLSTRVLTAGEMEALESGDE